MRAEEEFAAYVASRWAPAVRSLVLLGLPFDMAEEVAARSLADVREDWADLRVAGDLDVELFRRVLYRRAEALRTTTPDPHDPQTFVRGRLATAQRAAQVEAFEVVVRRWPGPPATLLCNVLGHVAGLEEVQVAEVVGRSSTEVAAHLRLAVAGLPGRDARATLGLAAALVEPSPPSLARVRQVVARKRRRRLALSGATVLVLVVGVGAVQWAVRPERPAQPGDSLPRLAPVANDNPIDFTWWADGVLHLPRVDLTVADVSQVVATGPGAVYRTGDGALVRVGDDGRRTYLGRTGGGSPLVASPDGALVAWVDVRDPRSPQVVVYDVRRATEVARHVSVPRARAITFDGDQLFLGQSGHDYAWRYRDGEPIRADSGQKSLGRFGVDLVPALVDVVGDLRVEQAGPALDLVQPADRLVATVPGFGGSLSRNGELVLTGPERGREPRLYDTATGERIPVDMPLAWEVREAALTSDNRVVWVVDTEPEGDGGLALVSCLLAGGIVDSRLAASPCADPIALGDLGDDVPVLARQGAR